MEFNAIFDVLNELSTIQRAMLDDGERTGSEWCHI